MSISFGICDDRTLNFCRICLCVNGDTKSLFCNEICPEEEQQILSLLVLNTLININIEDPFPKRICEMCLEDIRKIIQFFEKCNSADKALKESCNEASTNIKQELIHDEINTEDKNEIFHETEVIENKKYESICDRLVEIKQEKGSHSTVSHSTSINDTAMQDNVEISTETTNILKFHMADQRAKPTFQCITCGKILMSESALRAHNRIHTGEKPYKCKFCDKRFTSHNGLNSHQPIHTRDKTRPCKVCGARIKHGEMFAHTKKHYAEKLIRCNICNAGFSKNYYLKMHMLDHTGERPAVCEVCGKGFKTDSQLKRHMVNHTGIKSHMCPFCGATFAQSGTMRTHIKLVHKDIPSAIEKSGIIPRSTSTSKNVDNSVDT